MTTSHVSENEIWKTDGIGSGSNNSECLLYNEYCFRLPSIIFIYLLFYLFVCNSTLIFLWGTLSLYFWFFFLRLSLSIWALSTWLNWTNQIYFSRCLSWVISGLKVFDISLSSQRWPEESPNQFLFLALSNSVLLWEGFHFPIYISFQ